MGELTGLQGLHQRPDLAFVRFDDQAVFGKLRRSLRTHQELHVCAPLYKLCAEVPAERARAKNQKSHACPTQVF
jgi:hypothetical protein